MQQIHFNSPPEVLSTEEQHFAFPPLQGSLHPLNAVGEAELLYATGTHKILACVHPESGPCKERKSLYEARLRV